MPAAHDAPAAPADPAARLDGALRTAIAAVTGLPAAECDPQIRPSANPQFGDYQANFAMALAKRLGKNPRQLATEVVAAADLASVADKAEVAGPGFVNIHLEGAALAAALDAFDSPALGIARAAHDLVPWASFTSCTPRSFIAPSYIRLRLRVENCAILTRPPHLTRRVPGNHDRNSGVINMVGQYEDDPDR